MSKALSPLMAFERIKFCISTCYVEKNRSVEQDLDIIEKALKDYGELTNKPVILYGRTHKKTQGLIDTICKNYKEVKITNLEDENKLKALEIIKETPIFAWYITIYKNAYEMVSDVKGFRVNNSVEELQEMFDLLKEVLL